MQELNLPSYSFKVKKESNQIRIFDVFRKKYVKLTPEEWVRQNYTRFLIDKKEVPPGLVAIEKKLVYNKMTKRADIVVYGKEGTPKLVVECKAPEVKIAQETFDQIARYNMTLRVNYLAVTNGIQHYYCWIDHRKKRYSFLKDLPDYCNL